ncbi:hypothetical protein I4U23_009647 [Adineta vaga]|nr:hypothetical protein I4U23_009647 [Adineta vaga]
MSIRERLIGERLALYDQDLELIINKSDSCKTLLLQSIFDRQIQEYIHWNRLIPIEIYDKYMYRINSFIIHHPSDFDRYENLLDKNRFIAENEYHKFAKFFSNFLYIGNEIL